MHPISSRVNVAETCPWTRIALLRGSDWLAADRPKYLIIRTDDRNETAQPLHADLLTLQPFLATAWLKRATGETVEFSLATNGSLAILPSGVLHSSIDAIAAPAVRGICNPTEFETLLPAMTSLIVAGHCSWFEDNWCASPLGYRTTDGLWTQFMTTGGAGGLAFSTSSYASVRGIALKSMGDETTEVQYFAMLTEALGKKFPQLGHAVIAIDTWNAQSAAVLVTVRKAVGPYALSVTVASDHQLTPPWKRLLEHLNGVAIAKDLSRPIIALSTLVQFSSQMDFDVLIQQINRHSQVIPHGMLTSS